MPNSSKLIVALDYSKEGDAQYLIRQINPDHCALKIGSEMFTALGPTFVKQLVQQGYQIFLDLKFHDIPNTVAKACAVAARLGVWMVNVHASGGLAMMQAARQALEGFQHKPLLIAVTVLTSMQEDELLSIGVDTQLTPQVNRLAQLAYQAGLDGVVCSPWEVPQIKSVCSQDFLTVTPGIRLEGDALNDQKRTMTPIEAIKQGSDYLVIGRPITQSNNPPETIQTILKAVNHLEK